MNERAAWTVKKQSGVWWLVSPKGRRMVYTSVQCVGPRHGSRVKGAPAYDGIKASGGLHPWIDRTEARLHAWGFKGLGAWNHQLWRWRDVPYTECLNIWKSLWVKGKLKPVFDPDWEATVERFVAPQIKAIKEAPSLVGWFLDNEIPWGLHWLDDYFGWPAGNPNRQAALAFLRRRHGTIGRLNRAWGTKLSSFAALARLRKIPAGPDATRQDRLAFLGLVARRFFTTTCAIVRKLDPNRPILGVRYAGFPLAPVVAAQRGCTDVVSMNFYIQEGEFPAAKAEEAHRLSGGQPVWITEFSWHAPFDNRSGDRNTIGFGSRVRHQKSRGVAYEKFVQGGARLPFVIGFDWFQWCDESPQGRNDGEDVNFGLVDIKDRAYEDLTRRIARTNHLVDRLHAGSAGRRAPRGDEAPLPALDVPRGGAPLAPLRMRPGPDPRPARIPVSAWVAWSPEALFVAADVRDATRTVDLVKTKRSIEWFWMTDVVEVLVRAGESAPEAMDAASLKAFAVPDGAGKGRPFIGAWRNHRKTFGGAAGFRAVQTRIPGGYRMKFRIPASSIQAGPLRPGQVLRFNLLADDCEKVQETCWSAHQGDWTTERPGTWGCLRLRI